MASTCKDSSNDDYRLYWFDYFVSIGYIDSSTVTNPYAPYGKCTRSLLWLSYLINIVHFFLLSSGILYILNHHRHQSGFWWPFTTWLASLALVVASIVLFVLLMFSIVIIAAQLSMLIILWISLLVVAAHTFTIEYRYQRCLRLFIAIAVLMEAVCFVAQALITLHCLFNLKFFSTFLDYGYWAAIAAAVGTIIATLFLDYIFVWCGARRAPLRINPAPASPLGHRRSQATSPIESVILEDFRRQPDASAHQVYSNRDRTRQFCIQAARRSNRFSHELSTTSDA